MALVSSYPESKTGRLFGEVSRRKRALDAGVNIDALLALADEMDAYTKCDDERCGREMPPRVIHDFASRIREDLGDCQRCVSGVGCRGASRGPSGQVAGVALVAPREGAGEKE